MTTYWHKRDARRHGFVPQRPGAEPSVNSLMHHIARGTVVSPFISLTRSFGVAKSYALAGRRRPTPNHPGYVYEIEWNEHPYAPRLLDPVKELSLHLPEPYEQFYYQHDGPPEYLLGIVSPTLHRTLLSLPYPQPPPAGGTPRSPRLTIELESIVRALRDAEVLACGPIPASHVRNRYEVY